jgi:formate dehydrogenase major subunit
LFPSAQVGEYEGSFTNTQRMLRWHFKAADPPGDCCTDPWFTYQLGTRLKKLYANSTLPRDQGFRHLLWDYESETSESLLGEPDPQKILKEINGYETATGRHLGTFAELKHDGTTTGASWIYCGVFPAPDKNLAARKEPDLPGVVGAHLNWRWSWPANRRVMYNRASADPGGKPWSERKKWIWWDG